MYYFNNIFKTEIKVQHVDFQQQHVCRDLIDNVCKGMKTYNFIINIQESRKGLQNKYEHCRMLWNVKCKLNC